jgi:1-deoxy-D-xylulose-5-phosphate synthase
MKKMLDIVNGREELIRLNTEQMYALADEIREYIIDTVSDTGGHLASNLGSVELTIALHRVLRLPKDKLIWDVGHQSYTHKILSGRKDEMKNIRKLDGICGFCSPQESEYDPYTSGHTSTSLSLALGAACARDLKGEKYNVAAVIGDGAMTGGLSLEAMNNIGHESRKMLIILNDNEMSISKNVGAMSSYLTRARTSTKYTKSKQDIENSLEKLPHYGQSIAEAIKKAKEHVKYLVSPGVWFEQMGITYLGPIDGHDIRLMEDTFRRALKLDEPVMVHVVTKKGKGYPFAEKEPQKYHGVPPFEKKTGVEPSLTETYSSVFGKTMCLLAERNENMVVITPAMTLGSGLKEFSKNYKDRFYDVGIAEAHAVTFAAGLAGGGAVPVVSLYSSFAQRAYDSIIHDVAISNLHVVFAIDRAGLVPGDGKTHQGTMDISFFSAIPNIKVLSPSSFNELRQMLCYAVEECDGPVVVRYPRGGAQCIGHKEDFAFGKSEILQEGDDLTLFAEGVSLPECVKAFDILKSKGINAEIINARVLKPLDSETVIKSVKKTKRLACVEQGVKIGGIGERIFSELEEKDIEAKCMSFALDEFVVHGTYDEIAKKYSLDGESIAKKIEKEWFAGEEKT